MHLISHGNFAEETEKWFTLLFLTPLTGHENVLSQLPKLHPGVGLRKINSLARILKANYDIFIWGLTLGICKLLQHKPAE